VEFLNRAIELSPNDWTLYSALGVSYDQLGNQISARTAYEHALSLRPNEPSVLNNYALSRMLAGDPEGARVLIGRAQAAGGASDSKIAANIALLNKVAPAPAAQTAVAEAQKPAAQSVATANNIPQPAPVAQNTPVAQDAPHPIIPSQQPVAPQPPKQIATTPQSPEAAPRSLIANLPATTPQRPKQVAAAPTTVPSGVVMQAVPFDPYAGPVAVRPTQVKVATAPSTSQAATAKPATPAAKPADTKAAAAPKPGSPEQAAAIYLALKDMDTKDSVKTDAKTGKPGNTKPALVRTADQVPDLRLTADARNP
jgi:hypothetical protein